MKTTSCLATRCIYGATCVSDEKSTKNDAFRCKTQAGGPRNQIETQKNP